MKTPYTAALLAAMTLASGCLGLFEDDAPFDHPLAETDFAVPDDLDLAGAVSADALTWPDLSGATLRILDHGAFAACADAGARFQDLTGAKVECTSEADTGSALQRAILGKGDPEFDVLYGVDNILLSTANDAAVLQAYTPRLAPRVVDEARFFTQDPWPATPVDHGYIALNIDHEHPDLAQGNITIDDLFDVRAHAGLFVTQDPRFSTPGLGFLLITIAVFGEDDAYDWQDYWADLFDGGVRVTADWSTAYETYFSGGYGVYTEGHVGDRPIVTSYTESPAYEAYYGAEAVADVLLRHQQRPAVFHQVQTMAILAGTPQQAVAEAWIEFTLTDDFQALAAPLNAVYPVVASVSTDDVYGAVDPEPGTFETLDLPYATIGARLQDWLDAWTDLCQARHCA